MIIFENKGTLDTRSIKIMGVSSKDDKASAIGYFGTGLKYAIAVLLRHGATVALVTGSHSYKFDVTRAKIRHDEFDIVTMNGEELGFTTELGKNWELWMAFRELYSNALDENGTAYEAQTCKVTKIDHTYVLVDHEEFATCFRNKDNYFLNPQKPVLFRTDKIAIFAKNSACEANIFLKGVRVMESRIPALYDYNFLGGLTLTEDRTVKGDFSITYELARAVISSQEKKLIRDVVMAHSDLYEANLSFTMVDHNAGDTFLDVVGELREKYKDVGLNQSAIKVHKRLRKVASVLPGVSCYLNSIEQQQFDKATKFCKDALGLELDKYRIIVAKDLGSDSQLGRADIENGIMYISKQCFREGTKRVAVALLEEYTHCHHNVEDETVEQKWVYLNQILSLGEQLQGTPL